MEEILTIYNQSGKRIGKERRSTCHKKGLIHKAVYILLFNNENKLFVQKRSMRKSLYAGYYTASASGHVAHGESALSAAKRELLEELAVKAKLKFLGRFRTFVKNDKEIGYIYKCTFNGPIQVDTKEAVKSKSKFFSFKQIKKLKLSPHFISCLHFYNQKTKK